MQTYSLTDTNRLMLLENVYTQD